MFDIFFTNNKFETKEPQDHPNFKNKGKRGLRCNRTVCLAKEAYWWNKVTLAFYCQSCAHAINTASCRFSGEKVLSLSLEDKKARDEARGKRHE